MPLPACLFLKLIYSDQGYSIWSRQNSFSLVVMLSVRTHLGLNVLVQYLNKTEMPEVGAIIRAQKSPSYNH